VTPQQRYLQFAALDVRGGDRNNLVALLRRWQAAVERLISGQTLSGYSLGHELTPTSAERAKPPLDTGEAVGQGPDQLTITIGFGPGLFDQRFGLAEHRPPALVDLPRFHNDRLRPAWCGGDLSLQVCASTQVTAEHALRSLVRLGEGTAALRWLQSGFYEPPTEPKSLTVSATPRNLLGFKDGTANLDPRDSEQMNRNIWVAAADGPRWMTHGSYQVIRRISLDLAKWDRTPLGQQQDTFGRYKASGAPFGGRHEFDRVVTSDLPHHCHVALANRGGPDGELERILRRGFNYQNGYDPATGDFASGLFFIAYQRDPRRQFITIQRRLATRDNLNAYTSHIGSGIYAVPPAAARGGYVGEALFDVSG
jgi:deferrochelatase/peroxidase EfeB